MSSETSPQRDGRANGWVVGTDGQLGEGLWDESREVDWGRSCGLTFVVLLATVNSSSSTFVS